MVSILPVGSKASSKAGGFCGKLTGAGAIGEVSTCVGVTSACTGSYETGSFPGKEGGEVWGNESKLSWRKLSAGRSSSA